MTTARRKRNKTKKTNEGHVPRTQDMGTVDRQGNAASTEMESDGGVMLVRGGIMAMWLVMFGWMTDDLNQADL